MMDGGEMEWAAAAHPNFELTENRPPPEGQNISHLFGPGTTVLIGLWVSFWVGLSGLIGNISERT
jgi:hypothetical protein